LGLEKRKHIKGAPLDVQFSTGSSIKNKKERESAGEIETAKRNRGIVVKQLEEVGPG